jgi:hypothetical protein
MWISSIELMSIYVLLILAPKRTPIERPKSKQFSKVQLERNSHLYGDKIHSSNQPNFASGFVFLPNRLCGAKIPSLTLLRL